MKKIILFVISLFAVSLHSSLYDLSSVQGLKDRKCSLCGLIFMQKDFLEKEDYSDGSPVLCSFCRKMMRGKKDGVLARTERLLGESCNFSSDDESDEHDSGRETQGVLLSKAGKRNQMIVLREARTGLERKDKPHFKKLAEQEIELARQHAWTYRVLDDHTVDIENVIKKIHCSSKIPLTHLLYRGSCVIFSSEQGYRVHDFATGDTASFYPEQLDELNAYLETLGYGTDFRMYIFSKSFIAEPKAASKKILISPQDIELRRKKEKERQEKLEVEKDTQEKTQKLCFSDAQKSMFFTMENKKPEFYYAVAEDKKTLLVGNESGYILKWPVESKITGLLARGTEAIVTTKVDGVDKQIWHDFARHNEDDIITFQEYPITSLEGPLQSKEELMKQGFLESAVRETTFDQMFHEMAVIPEGFTQTIYHPTSLQKLVERLKNLECKEGRSLDQESHECQCEINAETEMVDVFVKRGMKEEEDGFEITINNPKDCVWKRGAEILVPDNGYLVLYNFKTEEVERFDTEKITPIEEIEGALTELKFNKIK